MQHDGPWIVGCARLPRRCEDRRTECFAGAATLRFAALITYLRARLIQRRHRAHWVECIVELLLIPTSDVSIL